MKTGMHDYSTLENIAFLFAGQEGLSEFYVQYLKTLGEIIKPHIKNFAIDPDFFEDYTVYVTDRRDDSIDPVPLLTRGKDQYLPADARGDLKNSLSYTTDDLAMLSWDSALLCNPDSPTDLIDLIEFANVQVLELRYYDRELTREMEKMYDDIEHADRLVPVPQEPPVSRDHGKTDGDVCRDLRDHRKSRQPDQSHGRYLLCPRVCNRLKSAPEQPVERERDPEDRCDPGKLLDAFR